MNKKSVKNHSLDVLFVNPDSSARAYQGLANLYSAIEPPTWALLLAESCRAKGFGTAILDCDALRLELMKAVNSIIEADPRLVVFTVYGQNPNSGTTNMVGAVTLAKAAKTHAPDLKIAIVGSHVSALPLDVLTQHPEFDIALVGEGVYALHNLLASDLADDLPKIKGIGFRPAENAPPRLTPAEIIVPQDRMDHDLPGYAWDLLPYKQKPLDLYRAHFWHAGFDHNQRTPFAAIYTSLGCRFACDFCMINIINRQSSEDQVHAAQFRGMRFWSLEWVLNEMDKLARLGVTRIRLSDEMFFLNRKYYDPLLRHMIERDYGFHLWAYSRVDTARPDYLDLFKKAGIDWLALGIEAGNRAVRQEASKGSFKDVDIADVCAQINQAGIHIIGNYIFGFLEDTHDTMQETLDLALSLNTETANMYPCQALPGSPMHQRARQEGWTLPTSYQGYGFLSYEAQPLPTRHVSAADVLRFRDKAWQTYFTNPTYLNKVEQVFGLQQRQNVQDMTKIALRRKLLGDKPPANVLAS